MLFSTAITISSLKVFFCFSEQFSTLLNNKNCSSVLIANLSNVELDTYSLKRNKQN